MASGEPLAAVEGVRGPLALLHSVALTHTLPDAGSEARGEALKDAQGDCDAASAVEEPQGLAPALETAETLTRKGEGDASTLPLAPVLELGSEVTLARGDELAEGPTLGVSDALPLPLTEAAGVDEPRERLAGAVADGESVPLMDCDELVDCVTRALEDDVTLTCPLTLLHCDCAGVGVNTGVTLARPVRDADGAGVSDAGELPDAHGDSVLDFAALALVAPDTVAALALRKPDGDADRVRDGAVERVGLLDAAELRDGLPLPEDDDEAERDDELEGLPSGADALGVPLTLGDNDAERDALALALVDALGVTAALPEGEPEARPEREPVRDPETEAENVIEAQAVRALDADLEAVRDEGWDGLAKPLVEGRREADAHAVEHALEEAHGDVDAVPEPDVLCVTVFEPPALALALVEANETDGCGDADAGALSLRTGVAQGVALMHADGKLVMLGDVLPSALTETALLGDAEGDAEGARDARSVGVSEPEADAHGETPEDWLEDAETDVEVDADRDADVLPLDRGDAVRERV